MKERARKKNTAKIKIARVLWNNQLKSKHSLRKKFRAFYQTRLTLLDGISVVVTTVNQLSTCSNIQKTLLKITLNYF